MADAATSATLDVAERLGDHGARIAAVEKRFDQVHGELREMRDILHRIENRAAAPQPAQNASIELMLHRLNDAVNKPPPAPNLAADIALGLSEALKGRRGDPYSIIGYLMGGGALAWIVRGLLGV